MFVIVVSPDLDVPDIEDETWMKHSDILLQSTLELTMLKSTSAVYKYHVFF